MLSITIDSYPVSSMEKKIYNTGLITYIALLLLSVVYYKERMVLFDSSLFLFEMSRTDTFMMGHRFIVFFTEFLPWLMIKMSMPIKAVALSYSMSFMLYYLGCYLLIGRVFKQYLLAVLLLFINILLSTHTFYWCISELSQGMTLFVLLLAFVAGKGLKWKYFIFIIPAIITVAFAHPLIVVPVFYALAFVFLNKKVGIKRLMTVVVTILFIITFYVKQKHFPNEYETASMGAWKNILKYFPDYWELYSTKRFIQNWFSIYYWVPISLLLITVTYIVNRKWLLLFFVLVSFTGHLLLVCCSYPLSSTRDFYIENFYLPYAIILGLPLLFDVFARLEKKNIALILGSVIFITGIARIYNMHYFYRGRVEWYRGFLDNNLGNKIVSGTGGFPMGTILMPWATPYEFWLLSTIEKDTTASIIIHEHVQELDWTKSYGSKSFITTWGVFDYSDLNPQYFKFRDTVTRYKYYREFPTQ